MHIENDSLDTMMLSAWALQGAWGVTQTLACSYHLKNAILLTINNCHFRLLLHLSNLSDNSLQK